MTMDTDAICFSSIDWDFNWQGQHEVATRLSRTGARVIFVENTSVRAPEFRDLGRILRRAGRYLRRPVHQLSSRGGINVYAPIVAPYPWSGIARTVNRYLFVRPVRRLARNLRDPLIWVFLPTPTVIDAVRACRTPRSVVIYWCVADFAEVTSELSALRKWEAELVREADLVYTNGHALRDRFLRIRSDVRVFPFGVDLDAFCGPSTSTEPVDLPFIRPPRAGYIGGLHRHLDIAMLEQAARSLPDVSFVLIGPLQVDLGGLRALRNVHVLGPRPHASLPGYVAGFDVSLIPYKRSAFTDSVVPTKLFEYLAVGGPVITTRIPELERLGLRPPVVTFADDGSELTQAIRRLLAMPPNSDDRRARRHFAERYSWDAILGAMLSDADAARARSDARISHQEQ